MNKTNSSYRFGIVIPVKDMPLELEGCIESVLSQEVDGRLVNANGRRDVQLLVVIDYIDEESKVILQRYDSRITWVEGDRANQSGAVIKGFEIIDADIIKWVNADDRLLPGALETVDSFFRAKPETQFLYGDIEFLDTNGNFTGEHLEPSYSKFILFFGHNLFSDPSCFWRQEIHDLVGPISSNTSFSLDFEFWLRLANSNVKFNQVQQKLSAFKSTGKNMSVVNLKAMRKEHYDLVVLYYSYFDLIPTSLRYGILFLLRLCARAYKLCKVFRERKVLKLFEFRKSSKTDKGSRHK